MKKFLLLIPAAVLAAGCASQESGEAASTQDHAAEAVPSAADAGSAGMELASVTGTMGCGHCAFDVTPSCAAALQTDAGVVWILEGVDESSRLFQERGDLGVVTVTGTKRAEGGLHYLSVASYETVPAEAGESQEG